MRTPELWLPLLLLSVLQFGPQRMHAALHDLRAGEPARESSAQSTVADLSPDELMNMDYREMRARTGVKLNFFQRVGLKMAQKQYRKAQERAMAKDGVRSIRSQENKLGLLGLILGGAGVLILFIPYLGILSIFLAVAAVVLGAIGMNQDAKPGLAIASVIVGSATILLMLIAAIVWLSWW